MKYKTKSLFLLVIAFLLMANGLMDDNLLNSLKSRSSEYIKSNPQEKLYLHLSQPYFAVGDHLWYKVYQNNAFTNEPKSLSGAVYVTLFDFSGNEILRQIIKMNEGAGRGDFIIPDSLPTGNYQLEARTNWMRNYPRFESFYRELIILNLNDSFAETGNQTNGKSQELELQFYPEGGDLINELETRVAFKAVDQNGEGVSVQGEIFDDQDRLIATFESLFFNDQEAIRPRGMGSFNFKPQSGRSYQARVTFGTKQYNFKLPPVSPDGFLLTVNNFDGDSLNTVIKSTVKTSNEQYLLLVQSQGEIAFSTSGNFADKASINIPRENLKHGINQVMLFDKFGNEVAKRLVFINHDMRIQLSANTDKNVYTPREKVSVRIKVSDANGKPVVANLSLSIRDKNQLDATANHHGDIVSATLLSSELTGDLESPAFYFSQNKEARKALDVLLMTKNWERFDWDNMKDPDSNRKEFRLEQGFSLKGRVTIPSNKEYQLDRSTITLSRLGTNPYFANQFLYDTAKFNFKELEFTGANTFDIQVISKQSNAEQIEVTLFDPHQIKNVSKPSQEVVITEEMRRYVDKQRLVRRISIDYPFSKNTENQSPTEALSPEHFEVDNNRKMDQYLPFADMRDIIREILPNVKIKKNKRTGVEELLIFDRESFTHTRKPTFMIDGILEFDQDVILGFDTDNIESIEVVRAKEKTAIFGPFGWGGMMIIHTYDKRFRSNENPNLTTIEIEGFHSPNEFMAPALSELDETTPDFRALTYWNPEIVTDDNGEATMSFYTSDEIGDFEIVIEGMTSEGVPISTTGSFGVER